MSAGRSYVWNHFTKSEHGATCHHCGKVLSLSKHGSTTLFISHLKRHHLKEMMDPNYIPITPTDTAIQSILDGAMGTPATIHTPREPPAKVSKGNPFAVKALPEWFSNEYQKMEECTQLLMHKFIELCQAVQSTQEEVDASPSFDAARQNLQTMANLMEIAKGTSETVTKMCKEQSEVLDKAMLGLHKVKPEPMLSIDEIRNGSISGESVEEVIHVPPATPNLLDLINESGALNSIKGENNADI